ncbi:MAG: hypothetical protein EOO73_02730 [Myxococcales bacterium]|nr:MAG: hypothetical protein EOO73_02730 [Myxococcales bacterium]
MDAALGDSLRFDIVDQVLLVVHADMPPSAHDWARLITVRDANRLRIRATLVVAPPRASLSAQQRSDVVSFMKSTGGGIAVLTDSALVRGVARALGLLGLRVRAYAPLEIASALDFCGVTEPRREDLRRRIAALQAQLAGMTKAPAPVSLPR